MAETLGFGGGCHWCTEAVFLALTGVIAVRQGFIRSRGKHATPAEAVEVDFDPAIISQEDLLDVHLATHASTDPRKAKGKYRSAVYVFQKADQPQLAALLKAAQNQTGAIFSTQILMHCGFTPSHETFQGYYAKNPQGAFCTSYIDPKLAILRERFGHLRHRQDAGRGTTTPYSSHSQ